MADAADVAEGVERMRKPLSTRPDLMPGERTWAAGVVLNTQGNCRSGPTGAVGHTRCGERLGVPMQKRIGIGYVHNQMGPDVVGDPRGIALCRAIYGCL